ncbi:MAG: LPXTG cell wall anchor domain-containing protein [Acidimicrobiia bacterium]
MGISPKPKPDAGRGKILSTALLALALLASLVTFSPFAEAYTGGGGQGNGKNNPGNNITICHNNNANSWTTNSPNANGIVNGHDSHRNDIIPSFEYQSGQQTKTYKGKNLGKVFTGPNGESATGAEILANGCKLPAPNPPGPKVTHSEWVDGDLDCEGQVVHQTRTMTTTPYKWVNHPNHKTWVLDHKNATTETENGTRELTSEEQVSCTPDPVVEFITVAWRLPDNYADGHGTREPNANWDSIWAGGQAFVTSQVTTPDYLLDVLDSNEAVLEVLAECGALQIDIYRYTTQADKNAVAALWEDGKLTNDGSPEDSGLHPVTGLNQGWKFLWTAEDCEDEPEPEPETWSLEVSKDIPNVSGVELPSSEEPRFTVSISCEVEDGVPYIATQTFDVGQRAFFDNIPEGASPCTVTETTPSDSLLPAGYRWSSPSYTVDAQNPNQSSAVVGKDDETYCLHPVSGDGVIVPFAGGIADRCVVVTNTFGEIPPPTPTIPEQPTSTTSTTEEVGGIDEEPTTTTEAPTTTEPEVLDTVVTPTTVAKQTLPKTGSNTSTVLSLAGVLMTAGAAFVLFGRRRFNAGN